MKKLAHTILIIFGITGDLAQRKLLPALYNLTRQNLLPDGFRIVGISRRGTTVEDIVSLTRKRITHTTTLNEQEEALHRLAGKISIIDMNIGEPEEYGILLREIERLETESGTPLNRLFYLAIPATLFETVTTRLGQKDININQEGTRESRFLIEKPFGYSLESAQKLIGGLSRYFTERQIYRIDHYLAKETAQNILAFRFENPLFSATWNRKHISHILITAVESIGIEGRAAFYDRMGAMRDLIQSHLLQLLALVTMDRPETMSDEHIHQQKEKILALVKPPSPGRMREHTVRGQYATYRDETDNPQSTTETYAAVRLEIDSEKWRGVPVFIRTGKAIKEKVTEINIVFSDRDHALKKNILTIRIQPNEGIVIDLRIKKPGFEMVSEEVQLDFCYADQSSQAHPEAYERVFIDAMRADRTLFASSAEVLECWRITEPILDAWMSPSFPLHIYENSSWGPQAADELIEKSGMEWLTDTHTVCSIPKRRPSN